MKDRVTETGVQYATGRVQQVVVRTIKEGRTLVKTVVTPADGWQYWKEHIFTRPDFDSMKEMTVALMLDASNRPVGYTIVSQGILNQALVHSREVFRSAIVVGANSIVLMHNHPSGNPTPSDADIAVTRQLIAAGKVIGINLVDHIVVTEDAHTSLRGMGIGF